MYFHWSHCNLDSGPSIYASTSGHAHECSTICFSYHTPSFSSPSLLVPYNSTHSFQSINILSASPSLQYLQYGAYYDIDIYIYCQYNFKCLLKFSINLYKYHFYSYKTEFLINLVEYYQHCEFVSIVMSGL